VAAVPEVTRRWVAIARPVIRSFASALRSGWPEVLKIGSSIAVATTVSLAWSWRLAQRARALVHGFMRSRMVRGGRPAARPATVRAEASDRARQVDLKPGPHAEAMQLAQHRLAAAERAFGYDHPSVAAELQLIGALHHEAANFNEAVAFYGAALGIQERTLGHAHPAAAATAADLAAAREDELEAIEMAERARETGASLESVAR